MQTTAASQAAVNSGNESSDFSDEEDVHEAPNEERHEAVRLFGWTFRTVMFQATFYESNSSSDSPKAKGTEIHVRL